MHMDAKDNLLPFRDPQDVPAAAACPRCGREVYAADGHCGYCERFGP